MTLCAEEPPGGPARLWGGAGAVGRAPDGLLGVGTVAGRRGLFLVGCPQIVPHPSLMST